MLTEDDVKSILQNLTVPYLNTGLSLKNVTKIAINARQIALAITLPVPVNTLHLQLLNLIQQQFSDYEVKLHLSANILPHKIPANVPAIPGVKNIIAIASGKGGVGKSTTCVNLALALAREGALVGILDADIYGPNQPQMLGLGGQQPVTTNKQLEPLKAYGISAMSIGFLIEQDDTPMIWRGPMVSSALQQMLNDTHWGDLDYLFIDLPPGTGDIQLTLAQKIPVTGGVIVTTPQDIALLDARKAIRMFEKVKVPVLGVIENMSGFQCSECGHHEAIFGTGGAAKLEREYQIELLGAQPLSRDIRELADKGSPTVVSDPNSDSARIYHQMALRIAAKLSLLGKDLLRKFPRIVVE